MKATIQFWNCTLRRKWAVTKTFKSQKDMDSYIDVVTTGVDKYGMQHDLDEVFIADVVDRFMSNTAKEFKNTEDKFWDNLSSHHERFSGDDY
tara:strand:+ start:52 stop:327 length:276 start_codon:yes stop_codon:yes gene_type:complete